MTSEISTEQNDALEYTRRNEFTSEIFKMEIKGLPRFFPAGQFKKLLSETLQLGVKKVKPTGKNHCFATFNNKESLDAAMTKLDGYKWKNNTLSTCSAAPAKDPLIVQQQQSKKLKVSEDSYKIVDEEVANLPMEEKIIRTVTPFAHLSYEEQLKKKQEMAIETIDKLGRELGKLNHVASKLITFQKLRRNGLICELDPIIPSPETDGYRNKCEFTIGMNPENNEQTVGFRISSYKSGSVSVGPIDGLKNVSDTMKKVVKLFEGHIRSSPYLPFDPVSHVGVWRQLLVRTSTCGDCLIAVTVHPQSMSETEIKTIKDALVKFVSEQCSDIITSLYCVVEGQKESNDDNYQHLWGETHIYEQLLGKRFRISPQAFFQVNTPACEKLYTAVGDLLQVDSSTILADVCCGTGTIGITLSEKVHKTFGLELVEEAVLDARHNAALNKLSNIDFLEGNCEQTLPSIFTSGKISMKAVVDPPRAGLPTPVITTLRKQEEVSTIIYLACDPSKVIQNFTSLCRPVSKKIRGQFFFPVRAVAVDMFPHTDKFELVVLFERYDEQKWMNIMNGCPSPNDVEYFNRIPSLPSTEQDLVSIKRKQDEESPLESESKISKLEEIQD